MTDKMLVLVDALTSIARDEEGLACSGLPHCGAVGYFGHHESCAVEIAQRALFEAGEPAPYRVEAGEESRP